MPTFTGDSQIGLVEVVDYLSTQETWVAVDFPQNTEPDRLSRIGLLIVSAQNLDGRLQVVEVFKLFGNGLFVLPRFPVPQRVYRYSIQFYKLTGTYLLILP